LQNKNRVCRKLRLNIKFMNQRWYNLKQKRMKEEKKTLKKKKSSLTKKKLKQRRQQKHQLLHQPKRSIITVSLTFGHSVHHSDLVEQIFLRDGLQLSIRTRVSIWTFMLSTLFTFSSISKSGTIDPKERLGRTTVLIGLKMKMANTGSINHVRLSLLEEDSL
jgi:hypothetical protein